MSKILTQQLDRLSDAEREQLKVLADKAGMSVEDWIEYSQKAQIYHNAEEILNGRKAA